MIFFAYASPMPGMACSSPGDAVLMSRAAFFGSAALACGFAEDFASDLAGADCACAQAPGAPTTPAANSTATHNATSLVMGLCIRVPHVVRGSSASRDEATR